MNTRPFRERLKEAAAYAGVEYSQTAIARALNTSKQTVDRWMADGEPRPAMIFHIADTWNVNPRWLATDEGDMVSPPPPGGTLSPEEHVLVRKYRSSPPAYRNSLKTILKLASFLAVIWTLGSPNDAAASVLHNLNFSLRGLNTHCAPTVHRTASPKAPGHLAIILRMADHTPEEKRLLELLADAESVNAPLQRDAQKIASMAQDARDVASAIGNFIRAQPPGTMDAGIVHQLTTSWERQNNATRGLRGELAEIVPYYSTQYALTTNASSTSAVTAAIDIEMLRTAVKAPQRLTTPVPPATASKPTDPIPAQLTQLAQALQVVFTRQELFPVVRTALIYLGLDRDFKEVRSPVSWLDECRSTLESPAGDETSALAVLIALRSCIERTIAELLRRRHGQEPASSWKDKLISIGKQCGRIGLPSSLFPDLGDTAERNSDNFAKAKDKKLSRDVVMLIYNDGLKFLDALLSAIDKARLRT